MALFALGLPAAAQTASFQGLGDLPGGDFYSLAYDVSADGAVVVGRSVSAKVNGNDSYEAFRWTADGGMVGLGRLPDGGGALRYASEAYGASADGSVVVGISPATAEGAPRAFRWTAEGGMVSLGLLPNANNSAALDVSADGAVVVGGSGSGGAFRWTAAGGMVGVGPSGGASYAYAFGVSADGSVAAGSGCSTVVPPCLAFQQPGAANLGYLPGASSNSSRALDVSADGAVVVGHSSSANGIEAFRWTADGGMIGLSDLPGGGFYSVAYGVSADGAVVVGESRSANGIEASRWTADGGMRPISALLTAAGADVSGWHLLAAWGVSNDGAVIVGAGLNPQGRSEAWRAVLPVMPVSSDLSPEAGQDLALSVSPNPVRGRATLRFRLPIAGPVGLSLVDALGRTVATVADGERAAGNHTVAVDTSQLPAGVYVARLDVSGTVRTKRITVVR